VFFNRKGRFLFDPKVYFDKFSQRFFIVVLEFGKPGTSLIHIAVSQSSDPQSLTSGWCKYKISGKSQGAWSDYPSVGMNEKWFAVSTNLFTFSNNQYKKAIIKVADITTLANNSNGCPKVKFFTFSRPESFTIHPAQHYSETKQPGNPLYMVSTVLFNVSTSFEFWVISGTGSKPTLNKATLTGTAVTVPPNARHKGSGAELDTGLHRVLHSVFRNGSVWAVMTTGCSFGSPPNEACIRLMEIIPGSSPNSTPLGTIGFEGTQGGGTDKFFWHPGLAINKDGDIVLAFQQSGSKLSLGTAFSGKRAGSQTIENFKLLKKGSCPIEEIDSASRNRSGDYVGAQTDPADDTSFWIAGEYAKKLGGACDWQTIIANVKY
jgi:hypothetical protein